MDPKPPSGVRGIVESDAAGALTAEADSEVVRKLPVYFSGTV